ncbi:MAG: hypothetical protein ACO3JL_20380, partial [Myxococcota bacterium]
MSPHVVPLTLTARYGDAMSIPRICIRSLLACVAVLFLAGCEDVSVASVSPKVIPQGKPYDVTIQGSGFRPGIAFSLSAGDLEVTLGAVFLIDEGLAEARVP